MKKPYAAIFVFNCRNIIGTLRRHYYTFLGLQIKGGGTIGKIRCNWPHKVSIGRNCTIEDCISFKITHPFSKEAAVKIGDEVFIGEACYFNCSNKIVIGDNCLIASHTTFVDAGHEIDSSLRINQQACPTEEIVIGDDVWIGTQSTILKGVKIGQGSIIGAGSVVNKTIPEYEIWAGVPAKFIRRR